MEERRRELISIMHQLRMEGAATKLVRDKLYVNGVLYYRSVEDHHIELTEREEKDYTGEVLSSQTSVFPENSGEKGDAVAQLQKKLQDKAGRDRDNFSCAIHCTGHGLSIL